VSIQDPKMTISLVTKLHCRRSVSMCDSQTNYSSCFVPAAGSKIDKSSAVAEMGDHGHNRNGSKRGGCCAPFAERWEPV